MCVETGLISSYLFLEILVTVERMYVPKERPSVSADVIFGWKSGLNSKLSKRIDWW